MEKALILYLAGPLFTQAERAWNLRLANALRKRRPFMQIILPQVETADAVSKVPPDFDAVQRLCIEGIERSSLVLAVFDGPDVDSGTAFECGYAYARNKPLIGIRTDTRGGEDEGMNAMLARSAEAIVRVSRVQPDDDELDSLANSIVRAVERILGEA